MLTRLVLIEHEYEYENDFVYNNIINVVNYCINFCIIYKCLKKIYMLTKLRRYLVKVDVPMLEMTHFICD